MTAFNHERPEDGSGLIVLAMGKIGAGELNYSSDIDLIVFFDPAATSLVPDIEPQPFFERVTQALSRLLQQRSGDGYVFRVDLRLRPDPASTQVAISTDSALHYYEREGRTWERAAMIKARPCAGDAKAGEALVAELAPFVWRKHLDFAALADVHDMKRQMQTYRGQSEIAVEGHNVKVGRGGIREIEFFAQTQQLIAGGRLQRRPRRSTPARASDDARLQEAGHGGRHPAALDGGQLPRTPQRGDQERVYRIHSRPDRGHCACRGPGRCGHRVRSLSWGVAARRAADPAPPR